ncbi:WD40 repeat domain-containing serine/threonine protein kinase [Micromonospora sp. NPDC005203]|uniref:WD40 repeat domain-containing serine/threonine protein kinase n=1 Tax=Micromonospora sp. NPDC005203 TaxID=3364226 RepID=UPI0036C6F729
MSDPRPAQRLVAKRYRLESVLGRGGMGVVWRATDELIGRTVAVKEIRAPVGPPGEERRLFGERALREARTAGLINHPAVVAVYDLVPATADDEAAYLVTELVDAPTLADLLDRDGALPPDRVTTIAVRVLDALKAAHSVGVVHRDVKPGNIMVLPGDEVKLLDFGIARAAGDARLTRHGMMGSTGYLAPELLHGSDPTPASDLWSVGVTLAQAVTGELPFEGVSTAATLHAVLYDDLPVIRCGAPLATVIAGLLTRDVAQRLTVEQARGLLDVPVGAAVTGRRDSPAAAAPERPAPADNDPEPEGESWERQATTVQPSGPPPPRQRPAAAHPSASSTIGFVVAVPGRIRRINVPARLVLLGGVLWVTLLVVSVVSILGLPGWTVFPSVLLPPVVGVWMLWSIVDPPHGKLSVGSRSVRFDGGRGSPAEVLWKNVAGIAVWPGADRSTPHSRIGVELTAGVPVTTVDAWRNAGVLHEEDGRSPVWVVADVVGVSPTQLVDKLRATAPGQVRIADRSRAAPGWSPRALRPLGSRRPWAVLSVVVVAGLIASGHLYLHQRLAALVALRDDPVSAVAFSPDGATLASANTETFGITLWDVADRRAAAVMPGHANRINVMAFSPDGKTFASGGMDGVIKLWNVANLQNTSTLTVGHAVTSLLFTPQGTSLAALGQGDVKVWPLLSPDSRIDLVTRQTDVTTIRFSQDGQVLMTLDQRGALRAWQTANGQDAPRIDGPVTPWADVSADGDVLIRATGSNRILATLVSGEGTFSATAFGPDDLFVTAQRDEIGVWRTTTGRTAHLYRTGPFSGPDLDFDAVALSAAGAAALGGDEGLWLWTYGSDR